ncbi:hypothetical protein B0T21DRAFT_361410, partial [Apiosordaria backusii]
MKRHTHTIIQRLRPSRRKCCISCFHHTPLDLQIIFFTFLALHHSTHPSCKRTLLR